MRTTTFAIIAAALCLAIATTAHANGPEPTPAPPTRTPGQGLKPIGIWVDVTTPPPVYMPAPGSQATANPSARANAHANAEAGSYSALASDIDFHSSMRSLTLPSSAIGAVVAPATGCLGSYVKRRQILWNGAETLDTGPRTDAACQLAAYADSLRANCRYHTAALVDVRLYTLLMPGTDWSFLIESAGPDLTLAECDARQRPWLRLQGDLLGGVAR
jgi:hypothetical protein